MILFRQFVTLLNVNSYRPGIDDRQSDQAGPDASNGDETVNNGSMDGKQIHVPFSTTQSKHSNAVGKRSIAGPSANRNER